MLKQNRGSDKDVYLHNTKAPLEHVMNNHQYCHQDWCRALKAAMQGKVYRHEEGWLHKERDGKIYKDLGAITNKYEVIIKLLIYKNS